MLVVVHNYFACNDMQGDVIFRHRLEKTFFFGSGLNQAASGNVVTSPGDAAVVLFFFVFWGVIEISY